MARQPRVGPAWENLARLLVHRRVQLDPRYRNRRVFCDEKQLDYRVISDIEGARRTNFSAPMLTAIEVAYDLADGAVQQALANPDLSELPPRRQQPADDELARPPANVPAHIKLADLEPWERGIWLLPHLTDREKKSMILVVRLRRGTVDDEGLLHLFHALGEIVERRLGPGNPHRRAM